MEISPAQTCEELLGLLGQFKTIMFGIAESYDLTPMQLGTLHGIMRGDVTMGAVARGLHCDASNVTGIVDRLVAGGLVTRQESTADRRAKTLELTAKGRRVMNEIMNQLPEALGCSKLSPAERAVLHAAIVKFAF
jgi:DNA-binding MarR family transcriptional regulator